MKILNETPKAFTPITIVIESREEAIRLAAAAIGGSYDDDQRVLKNSGFALSRATDEAPRLFSDGIMAALGEKPMRRFAE